MYKIADNGGRPSWSPDGRQIAFDRRDPRSGHFGLWIMNPDGSGQRPLLGSPVPGFPSRHAGNPSWHPSGRYLAINVQKQSYPGAGKPLGDAAAEPGIGFNNDLWIVAADGSGAWLVWENPTPARALEPQTGLYNARFSNDGRRIAWTHIYSSAVGEWGGFVIRVADFHADPTPRIDAASMVELNPVPTCNFKEVHEWSPDDSRLVLSGNWRCQHEYDQDVGLLQLSSGQLSDLTPTPADVWTEAAHYHPAGQKIFFMSSEGYPLQYSSKTWWEWLRTDYWMANPDGTGKRRLTFFNEPGMPGYTGEIVNVAQFSWRRDGAAFAGVLDRGGSRLEVWVFEFQR